MAMIDPAIEDPAGPRAHQIATRLAMLHGLQRLRVREMGALIDGDAQRVGVLIEAARLLKAELHNVDLQLGWRSAAPRLR